MKKFALMTVAAFVAVTAYCGLSHGDRDMALASLNDNGYNVLKSHVELISLNCAPTSTALRYTAVKNNAPTHGVVCVSLTGSVNIKNTGI